MMKRYFAKEDTWFKKGTEAFREEEMFSQLFDNDGNSCASALYTGTYVVGSCGGGYDKYWYDKGYNDGDEVIMREHCTDDEFDVMEE
jgi:hypothetical protein